MKIVSDLKVQDAVSKAIEDAVMDGVHATTSALLKDVASETIRAMGADAAAAILGQVAGNLLKAILKVQDGLFKRVDSLAREPFETGVRIAHESLALPSQSDEEAKFRSQRLQFAVEKLDQAETLAARERESEIVSVILLLGALCLSQVAGASPLARKRAVEALSIFDKQIDELDHEIRTFAEKAKGDRAAAAKELRKMTQWPKGRLALFNTKRPADYQVQADIYRTAAGAFEQKMGIAERKRASLKSLCEVLRSI